MKESNRLSTALKAIFQLGLIQTGQFALYRFGLASGHYRRMTPERSKSLEQSPMLEFQQLFELPSPKSILEIIGQDGLKDLVQTADEIVNGKVRLFGGDPVPLILSFKQSLQHWTAYEKDPSLYQPFFGDVQDVKFLWELSRFSWVFTLGRAWHLTQDEHYPEAFWKSVEEFLEFKAIHL